MLPPYRSSGVVLSRVEIELRIRRVRAVDSHDGRELGRGRRLQHVPAIHVAPHEEHLSRVQEAQERVGVH